jgi:Carboxypeptidase regulatory-like domain
MKRFVPANWVAVAILIFFTSGRLAAQAVANATIHGEITDATGAFVPNAQVKAIQTDTGQTVNTVTDSTGSYVLPNLPVGPYRL